MMNARMIQMKNSFGVVTDYKCSKCNQIIKGRGVYCDNCGVKLKLTNEYEKFKGIVYTSKEEKE